MDANNKTQPTDVDVRTSVAAIELPVRRADALALDAMFRRATVRQPRM